VPSRPAVQAAFRALVVLLRRHRRGEVRQRLRDGRLADLSVRVFREVRLQLSGLAPGDPRLRGLGPGKVGLEQLGPGEIRLENLRLRRLELRERRPDEVGLGGLGPGGLGGRGRLGGLRSAELLPCLPEPASRTSQLQSRTKMR
jgi:hypothetical protein